MIPKMSVYLELTALNDGSATAGTDEDFDHRLLAGVSCAEEDDYDQAKAYNESDEEPDVADLVGKIWAKNIGNFLCMNAYFQASVQASYMVVISCMKNNAPNSLESGTVLIGLNIFLMVLVAQGCK